MNRDAWDERYASRELVWSAGPNQFLVPEVADLQPGTALDVACGEGRNAIWLAEQGWKVMGVDFSAVAVDKARRLAEARGVTVDWSVADVVHDDLPRGPFDLALLFYLQLPLPTIHAVLARVVPLLGPGGTLLVVAHDSSNLTEGHGGPQDPSVLYTPDDVVAALDGLTVDKAEKVRRPVQTESGTVDAIDALVRAHRAA